MSYSQASRAIRIKTPLGDDALHVTKLRGSEGVSELFELGVELRKPGNEPIVFEELLGREIVLELTIGEAQARYFSGVAAELSELEIDSSAISYRLRLVPTIWPLTLGRRSRVFQQQTVPQILRKVLAGVDTEFHLSAEYPEHNLCVQYDESDFAFASRLMEEEGIYYYFEHNSDGHRLMIADTSTNAPALDNHEVPFGNAGSEGRQGGRVHQWHKSQRLTVQRCLARDFCFQQSNKPVLGEATISSEVAAGKVTHRLAWGSSSPREEQIFPGGFVHRFDGVGPSGAEQSSAIEGISADARRTARIRMEQRTVAALEIKGVSDSSTFQPGYRFQLCGHPHGDGEYLLTRLEHHLEAADFRSGEKSWSYENRFTAIPASLPYRPPARTPEARVRGTQTAIVLGMGSDPIRTDKFGRVKVRFHWDTSTEDTQDSSAWIRVAQAWAGSGWGMVNIPRANQEVVVDFLNGDPDCPIIIGSVYNQENLPPFDLPANKTLTGIKTDSHLSEESSSFSGLAFNDQDGQEEVHLRSQKDLVTFVKNNQLSTVSGQNFQHTGSVRFTSVGGFPFPGGSGSGSGSGGGEADDAIGWGWGLARQKLGQSYATNIGIEAKKGVGKSTTAIYGGDQTLIVDPMAWSDEFLIPIHSKLATVVGLVLGTGQQHLLYGQYVDQSYGARLHVQRGPWLEYSGSMAKDKFPTRLLTSVQPLPTAIALIAEEILRELKENGVDVLVGVNAGALVINAGLGFISRRSERMLVRTMESKLKLSDGSLDQMTAIISAPSSYTQSTFNALRDIKEENAAEAAKDLVFQASTSEQRAAKRILTDGPYSVRTSDMLELSTFAELSGGLARLNLLGETALLSANQLVSIQGGKSLVEVKTSGINVYGGANGTVQIGTGSNASQTSPSSQAVLSTSDITISTGQTSTNNSKLKMTASSMNLQVGGSAGPTIAISGSGIELKCGANGIKIDRGGVTIQGTLIKLVGQAGIRHNCPLVKVDA